MISEFSNGNIKILKKNRLFATAAMHAGLTQLK